MLEKARSLIKVNREVADVQRSTLILTTLISVAGVLVIAGLDAAHVILDDEIAESQEELSE